MSRRNDAARIGGKRPALGVDQADAGMGERATVDHDRSTNRNMRAGHGGDRLDEWSRAARAETCAQVAALEPEGQSGPRRHADKDEVANLDRRDGPLDAPETKRIARGRIQAEAARPAEDRDAGDGGRAKSQH